MRAFGFGELLEPLADRRALAHRGAHCEVDEDAVVACLRRQEVAPQRVKRGVVAPGGLRQELEALARARLDQRGDEQAIDERGDGRRPSERAGRAAQRRSVRVDRWRTEGHAPGDEQRHHALEVLDLLAREVAERVGEIGIPRVPRHERERVRRCLELAVRVIDEDRVDVAHRGARP